MDNKQFKASSFGGKADLATWVVTPVYSREGSSKERMNKARDVRAKLAKAGFKPETRFSFSVADPQEKALQRRNADQLVENIARAAGIQMRVSEGIFLL